MIYFKLMLLFLHHVAGWTIVTRRRNPFSVHHRTSPSVRSVVTNHQTSQPSARPDTLLAMGLMDSLSNFLKKREGDFVKLDSSSDAAVFGPGPLLVAYGIPANIDNEEIQDMISDGSPNAFKKNCKIVRLSPRDDNVLDVSLEEALNGLADGSIRSAVKTTNMVGQSPMFLNVPVLFFSGFQNYEMLALYNILGKEIHEETAGQSSPACARAVPNAMGKPFRQVLDEISGDHKDAIALSDDD